MMKRGKLIAGAIWLAVGLVIALFLLILLQRLLISGVRFVSELGEMIVGEEVGAVEERMEPTDNPEVLPDPEDSNKEPGETQEPEELIVIPVEQTAEELAKENQRQTE